ncbi:hypothetical protein J2Z32_002244 [Paenibacillus turicensis]|uniref:Integrase SAM-like N-terminal domain-containing protein n=1 Tax=Paenibacillus turicensis TaxID=160487 RepID=A0ABS4FSQ8_9BACL|nr:hypothetical protein [Paenibacillus turicensis]MBP1905614.1 hypothetical protein [Paenibacillus turicensis]
MISVKKSEGLRERTLSDYKKHYRYFLEWLNEVHPDVVYVHEITMQILRDHVSYMKYDRVRYEEHKFISSENQTFGVSDTN